jgi:predicted  nucleic acid-binding Zn-ribbon protein
LQWVEGRVEAVIQEVEGEKLLSRYILKQARQNGDDLAALKSRVERIEDKIDRLEVELRALRSDIDSSQTKLPAIIADVMREVLRETKG